MEYTADTKTPAIAVMEVVLIAIVVVMAMIFSARQALLASWLGRRLFALLRRLGTLVQLVPLDT